MSGLIDRLLPLYKTPVQIHVHENRSSYLKIERRGFTINVHLHRLFEEAPTPVLEAIVRYTFRKEKRSLAVIRQMAHLYFSEHQTKASPLKTAGAVYDLAPIYDELKTLYFSPDYDATIGWSERKPRGAFRFVTFGTYDRQLHQIRINTLLDHTDVPLYFLQFIVYHEMLHAVCPAEIDHFGRARVHTRLFRQKEKEFAQYEAAKAWEKTSLRTFKKRRISSHGRT